MGRIPKNPQKFKNMTLKTEKNAKIDEKNNNVEVLESEEISVKGEEAADAKDAAIISEPGQNDAKLVGNYETFFGKLARIIKENLCYPHYIVQFTLYYGISILCVLAFFLSYKSFEVGSTSATISLVAMIVCAVVAVVLLGLLIVSTIFWKKMNNREKEM